MWSLDTIEGNGDSRIRVDFATHVAVGCIKLQADGAGVVVQATNEDSEFITVWTQTEVADTETAITELFINEMDSSIATFEVIPDISEQDIKQVMNWIKAEMTMDILPFYWKKSHGRGVGTIPGRPADCPSEYIQDGLTCRLPPKDTYFPSKQATCPSGYDNTGLTCFSGLKTYGKCCTTIWSKCNCKSGYVNMGCHCHRDAKSLGLESMTCPDGYSKGEPFIGRFYKRCTGGATRIGENCHRTMVVKGIDSMTCKEGEEKIDVRCFSGNKGCGPEREWQDGLCYKKCNGGFFGNGPVC
jgi:hypothetical protein